MSATGRRQTYLLIAWRSVMRVDRFQLSGGAAVPSWTFQTMLSTSFRQNSSVVAQLRAMSLGVLVGQIRGDFARWSDGAPVPAKFIIDGKYRRDSLPWPLYVSTPSDHSRRLATALAAAPQLARRIVKQRDSAIGVVETKGRPSYLTDRGKPLPSNADVYRTFKMVIVQSAVRPVWVSTGV